MLYNITMDKPRSKISKIIIAAIIIVMICVTIVLSLLTTQRKTETVSDGGLPAPELAEGIRGSQFGIDKNINESTIDRYLGRDDAVYRDLRMLKDPGNYEAIGGDSYLSGFIDCF